MTLIRQKSPKNIIVGCVMIWNLVQTQSLFAGLYIKQQVDTNLDGRKVRSENEWFIDQGKFKLRTTSIQSTTEYFFSGTVFYVCGKLTASQVELLKARHVSPQVIQGLVSGTCQVVPSNFMVRFFLSPLTSVESVDSSDGLKLTLALSQYQLKKVGVHSKAGQTPCEEMSRTYQLQKSKGQVNGSSLLFKSTIKENLCFDKTVEWRKLLWREVTKAVLVQQGGAKLLGELRKDFQELTGFPLKGKVELTTSTEGSAQGVATHSMQLNMQLISYVTKAIPAAELRLPTNVKIFNPESALAASGSGTPNASPGKTPPQQNLLDFLQSAVFCGLARGFCIQQASPEKSD